MRVSSSGVGGSCGRTVALALARGIETEADPDARLVATSLDVYVPNAARYAQLGRVAPPTGPTDETPAPT